MTGRVLGEYGLLVQWSIAGQAKPATELKCYSRLGSSTSGSVQLQCALAVDLGFNYSLANFARI